MEETKSFDWNTDLKEVPVREWEDRFVWVEEPYVSSDGEAIASIVNVEEAVFTVCENGETWDNEYEKAWCLRPLPDGKFAACVSSDEEWTLSIGGNEWENRFDFIWDFQVNHDGTHISLAVQTDSEYGMAVNDEPWDPMYANINEMVLSDTGNTAAVVQVSSMAAADIETFKQGIFSCAVNGKVIEKKFLNIWDISFDTAG
ncbi:MAG: Tmc redox complex protein TmcD, partial [Desulfobacula sp.]|nr:Tmc redox complex protein TmcD [Desulfobacula sp.]